MANLNPRQGRAFLKTRAGRGEGVIRPKAPRASGTGRPGRSYLLKFLPPRLASLVSHTTSEFKYAVNRRDETESIDRILKIASGVIIVCKKLFRVRATLK